MQATSAHAHWGLEEGDHQAATSGCHEAWVGSAAPDRDVLGHFTPRVHQWERAPYMQQGRLARTGRLLPYEGRKAPACSCKGTLRLTSAQGQRARSGPVPLGQVPAWQTVVWRLNARRALAPLASARSRAKAGALRSQVPWLAYSPLRDGNLSLVLDQPGARVFASTRGKPPEACFNACAGGFPIGHFIQKIHACMHA
jgi:hypothetical protein